MQKKTRRTTNSAKIPLSHLTERYLTNGTRMRVTYGEIFTRCHQGLGCLMGQSCDSISRNLPDVYPMFQRPDKFLVTEVKVTEVTILPFLLHLEVKLITRKNQTYSIIILTSSSVTTKISTTHFSFFPTVILVTEVTTLTVHPESCYCEREFLSTGFCSSLSVLRIKKSKLK